MRVKAIIYSIIESCRRHDIEPHTYLRDVLSRLPTMTNRQIKDIVPKAWAAANRNTQMPKMIKRASI
jgi:transposase